MFTRSLLIKAAREPFQFPWASFLWLVVVPSVIFALCVLVPVL